MLRPTLGVFERGVSVVYCTVRTEKGAYLPRLGEIRGLMVSYGCVSGIPRTGQRFEYVNRNGYCRVTRASAPVDPSGPLIVLSDYMISNATKLDKAGDPALS